MDLRASVAARPAAVAAARALAILRFVDFEGPAVEVGAGQGLHGDRKSTRLNSSHDQISYAVFCLKKKLEYRTVDPGVASSTPVAVADIIPPVLTIQAISASVLSGLRERNPRLKRHTESQRRLHR